MTRSKQIYFLIAGGAVIGGLAYEATNLGIRIGLAIVAGICILAGAWLLIKE